MIYCGNACLVSYCLPIQLITTFVPLTSARVDSWLRVLKGIWATEPRSPFTFNATQLTAKKYSVNRSPWMGELPCHRHGKASCASSVSCGRKFNLLISKFNYEPLRVPCTFVNEYVEWIRWLWIERGVSTPRWLYVTFINSILFVYHTTLNVSLVAPTPTTAWSMRHHITPRVHILPDSL